MNKYQRAFYNIDYRIISGKGVDQSYIYGQYKYDSRAILELVDKATPKKPTVHCSGYFSGIPIYDEYSCPSCGARVDDTEHHCKCGQALDWGDEE